MHFFSLSCLQWEISSIAPALKPLAEAMKSKLMLRLFPAPTIRYLESFKGPWRLRRL